MKRLNFTLLFLVQILVADVRTDVQAIVFKHLEAVKRKDLAACMRLVHRHSPVYESTQNYLQTLLTQFEMHYTFKHYRFIGTDSNYAYAKVTLETRKLQGPPFESNVAEVLWTFKPDDKGWKYWNQSNISMKPIKIGVR